MNDKDFNKLIRCLGIIYICIMGGLIFSGLVFISVVFNNQLEQSIQYLNTISTILNIIVYICIFNLLIPLMKFFKHLYQKNKED